MVKKFENAQRSDQGFFIWCLSKTGKDIATFSSIYHPSLMVKICKLNTGIGFLRM